MTKIFEGGDNDPSSEEPSDEEEEEVIEEAMFVKPVFVPKHLRGENAGKSHQDIIAEQEAERRRRDEEKRKEIARSQLADTLRRSEMAKDHDNGDNDSNAGIPEDVSDYDEDVEVRIPSKYSCI